MPPCCVSRQEGVPSTHGFPETRDHYRGKEKERKCRPEKGEDWGKKKDLSKHAHQGKKDNRKKILVKREKNAEEQLPIPQTVSVWDKKENISFFRYRIAQIPPDDI